MSAVLQQNVQFRTQRPLSFYDDMKARLASAQSHGSWQFIVDSLANREFVPAELVMAVARDCPLMEIQQNLLGQLRDYILNLMPKALTFNEGRICTFVTASSLVSAGDFLKTTVLLSSIYRVTEMPVPRDVLGRFNACQRVIGDEGGFTHADLISAGYEQKVVHARVTYVHPHTADIIVLPNAKKLAGGALLSIEEQAKRALANKAIREQERLSRKANAKQVKLKIPKAGATSESANKKQGGKKK